jgi:hypothetical protein
MLLEFDQAIRLRGFDRIIGLFKLILIFLKKIKMYYFNKNKKIVNKVESNFLTGFCRVNPPGF